MKKKLLIPIILIIIIVAVVIFLEPSEKLERLEKVGGKYNAVIKYWKNGHTTIEYKDEKGIHSGMFIDGMRKSLDWIRENTPKDAVFLCWWDYGHMIKGYAERDAIIKNPSKEILSTVADPKSIKEFDDHRKIVDVAIAFTTANPNKTLQIMEKYGAIYVLVVYKTTTRSLKNGAIMYPDDGKKAFCIFYAAGLNASNYFDPDRNFNEKGKQSMIYQFLTSGAKGFTLIYQDEVVKIYKRK